MKIPHLSICLLLAATVSVFAQDGVEVDDALFTVGTTTDASGADYAYLLWQASDDSILKGDRSFAVYKKAGSPGSANPFARVSITTVHQDPALIAPLLQRSAKVGEDLAAFEQTVTNLFQDAMPAVTLTLAQRVSIVIQGAIVDDDLRSNLMLLARQHPAAALSLGQAWAEPISGLTTFEIREWDGSADLAVVGRVTLDPSAPSPLPAPVALTSVPDRSPKGHLNVKLRWATPNPLRRLTLLTSGFEIFRMDEAYAVSKGYHLSPPAAGLIRDLVAIEPSVAQVNRLPVMTERDLSVARAMDPADTETWFAADDNGRFLDGGSAFANGARYYYFAAARDVLGNLGTLSQGLPVTICDRMPPVPPQLVSVDSHYDYDGSGGDQRLQVVWPQPKTDPDSGNLEYHVYRWQTIEEMSQMQHILDPATGDPFMRRIAVVPHDNAKERYSVVDDGAGAPFLNKADPGNGDNAGQTFWYTVRVRDTSACGGNWSGNSAPAFGVLRDRQGPGRPQGSVLPCCFVPLVEFEDNFTVPNPGGSNDKDYLELLCEHPFGKAPAFADFYGANQQILGRVRFDEGSGAAPASASTILEYPKGTVSSVMYGCRVVMSDGTMSDIVTTNPQSPQTGTVRTQLRFTSSLKKSRRIEDCGEIFDPVDPFDGSVTGPGGTIATPQGAREYKIYRRVSGGRRTLIAQGTTASETPESIDWVDPSPPSTGAEVCYFGQVFDVHGNPGPMIGLGCVQLQSDAFLPTPLLAGLEGSGTEASPEMTISWFCTPYGVGRFEVWIAAENGDRVSALGDDLRGDLASSPNPAVDYPDFDFAVFETRRIVPGTDSAEFSYTVPIELGVTYRVAVRAVGSGEYGARSAGEFSNLEDFLWTTTQNPTGPDVPWPARPLPEVNDFHDGIKAVFLDIGTSQVRCPAVRIGEATNTLSSIPVDRDQKGYLIYQVNGWDDPLGWLYTNENAADNGLEDYEKSLFSVVMYRLQVPNAAKPQVSGDIVQVTPMMEQMAFNREQDANFGRTVKLRDPYVGLFPHSSTGCVAKINGSTHDLFLFDSQPAITGASYRYLLVRYDKGREISQVIDCGTVAVP